MYHSTYSVLIFITPGREFFIILVKMNIHKLDFLIAMYITCIAISELMGAKTFPLFMVANFPFHASVGIFVVPIIYSINDTITEVFGKKRAQSVVWSGLIMVGVLLVFSLLATHLPASQIFLSSEKAYEQVFAVSARIAGASLTAFAFAQFLDVLIFTRLRQQFGKRQLWFRTNASNFISEFFDTALFIKLAFYAFDKPVSVNLIFLCSLILPYWLLKCFMSIAETPLVYFGVKWLRSR